MDLAFAISATASNADRTFKRMKEIMHSIVDKYGSSKIHYGLVVFGASPVNKISFGDIYPSDENLKTAIEAAPRVVGSPSLDKLLSEGNKLFSSHKNHPKARKVLVIIIDNKSGDSPSVIQSKAKNLIDRGVLVIPVAIGNNADPKQLEKTTDDKGNVIKEEKDGDDPDELGEKIMEKILKGIQIKRIIIHSKSEETNNSFLNYPFNHSGNLFFPLFYFC